jgi:hypothetical protein
MDLRQFLATTSQITSAGRYAEALERTQWFHHNAQSQGPAAMALRLQESLEIWRQLALVYPPAHQTLVQQRDQTSRTLGNPKVRNLDLFLEFRDLAAINRALGQTSHTVETLEWLRHARLDTAAYQPLLWNVSKDAVIASRRTDLLQLYVPDTEVEFQRLLQQWDESIRLIPQTPALLPPSNTTSQTLATSAQQVFVGQCLDLMEICHALGDHHQAATIQARAMAIVQDPKLRQIIKTSSSSLSLP